MASTTTKRIWYAPYACEKSGTFPYVTILGFKRKVCPVAVEAFEALDKALKATGRTSKSIGTYNCRPITGGTKLSLHAFGIADDDNPFALGNGYYAGVSLFSWSRTDFTPEQVAAVEAIKTKNGKKVFRWGGWWTIGRDYMHWEIDCSPSDLATGIDWSTVKGAYVAALPLIKGMQNEDVRELQDLLNQTYDAGIKEDADYGSITSAAVAASPMPSYTGDKSDAVKNGERVNANMWNGLHKDWILKFVGESGSGITQDQADDRYVRRGIKVSSKFD